MINTEMGGFIVVIIIVAAIVGGLLWWVAQPLPISTMDPIRRGNTVSMTTTDGWGHSWPNEVDQITLSLSFDNQTITRTVFAHAADSNQWAIQLWINTPMNEKAHAIATVKYTDGTTKNVIDRWI
jgi:hypothetical protein